MKQCDLLISNGLLFDGLNQGIVADVAIRCGAVLEIGQNLNYAAQTKIDATDLIVAPGFVDIHTHYDLEIEINPALSESARHGVTTVVMGNCSLSAIYASPDDLACVFSRVETLAPELIQNWLQTAKNWISPVAYFDHLKELKPGLNVATMLGHSDLRVKVMGLERSLSDCATKSELMQMKQLAEEALKAGCIGISIDMVHWHKVSGAFAGAALPSHHASFAEYKMLADVCRNRDAVFQVTPDPQRPFSIIDILRLSPGIFRAPLRVTILSAIDSDVRPNLWRLYEPLLFVFNKMFGCNIRFQALAEPFTIFSDGHLTPFFEEFEAGVELNNCKERAQRKDLWQNHEFRKRFRDGWSDRSHSVFHRDFARMTVIDCPDKSLIGKTIEALAYTAKLQSIDYFMTLLELYDEDLRWVACSANMRADILRKLLMQEYVLPGFSDAGAHSRNLAFFDNSLSVIRQAASSDFISMEEAIARVTSKAAQWFNLDAGRLKVGAKADLVLLDPERLKQPIPKAVAIADPLLQNAQRLVKREEKPAVRYVFARGILIAKDGSPTAIPEGVAAGDILTQLNPCSSEQESLNRYRNRVDLNIDTSSLDDDYWNIFLLKHQHPGNVALHLIGFLLMYAIPIAAFVTGSWSILLFFPLSQLAGLLGHFVFERSPVDQRDLVFSWRAIKSLHLMFINVLTGRYNAEIIRVRQTINEAAHAVTTNHTEYANQKSDTSKQNTNAADHNAYDRAL